MQEDWRDIPNYEGVYQVSSFGRVRRLGPMRTVIRELKLGDGSYRNNVDRTAYKVVVLCKNGRPKTFCVHRLVAEAFIDNPLKKPEVNHLDGDKSNNHIENLEWVTHVENIRHSRKVLGRASNSAFGNRRQPVRCIETGEVFKSKRQACAAKSIDRKDLYKYLRGEQSSTKGLHWETNIIN